MSNLHQIEYTDTYGGEANYCWVRRAVVSMPELTHYGYDGGTNYARADRTYNRELMKAAKAKMGLTGVRGVTHHYGDMSEFRPYGMNTILFVTYLEEGGGLGADPKSGEVCEPCLGGGEQIHEKDCPAIDGFGCRCDDLAKATGAATVED